LIAHQQILVIHVIFRPLLHLLLLPKSSLRLAPPRHGEGGNVGVFCTAFARYPRGVFKTLRLYAKQLNGPISDVIEELKITDPFVLNWLDMLCFLLQGLPSAGTMNAVIGYMLQDWYREGVVLDFPRGGSGRGVQKGGGEILVNSHVDQLIIEDNKAVGVRLKNGEEIRANQAVVCNLTPFTINKVLPETVSEEAKSYVQQNMCVQHLQKTRRCPQERR